MVQEYSYGRSDHRIEDKVWAPDYYHAASEAGKQAGLLKQMFFIFTIMQSIPQRLSVLILPSMKLILRWHRVRLPTFLSSLRTKGGTELILVERKQNCRSTISRSSPVPPIKIYPIQHCSTKSSPAISQNRTKASVASRMKPRLSLAPAL